MAQRAFLKPSYHFISTISAQVSLFVTQYLHFGNLYLVIPPKCDFMHLSSYTQFLKLEYLPASIFPCLLSSSFFSSLVDLDRPLHFLRPTPMSYAPSLFSPSSFSFRPNLRLPRLLVSDASPSYPALPDPSPSLCGLSLYSPSSCLSLSIPFFAFFSFYHHPHLRDDIASLTSGPTT